MTPRPSTGTGRRSPPRDRRTARTPSSARAARRALQRRRPRHGRPFPKPKVAVQDSSSAVLGSLAAYPFGFHRPATNPEPRTGEGGRGALAPGRSDESASGGHSGSEETTAERRTMPAWLCIFRSRKSSENLGDYRATRRAGKDTTARTSRVPDWLLPGSHLRNCGFAAHRADRPGAIGWGLSAGPGAKAPRPWHLCGPGRHPATAAQSTRFPPTDLRRGRRRVWVRIPGRKRAHWPNKCRRPLARRTPLARTSDCEATASVGPSRRPARGHCGQYDQRRLDQRSSGHWSSTCSSSGSGASTHLRSGRCPSLGGHPGCARSWR